MPRIWIIIILAVLGALVSGFSSVWQHVRLEALVSRSIIGAVVGGAVAVVYCMLVQRWFLRQEEKVKHGLPAKQHSTNLPQEELDQEEAQEKFQPLGAEEWQKLPK
jgi:phosphate/sulfate permease